MQPGLEPIRISYREGVFQLEAHLLISLARTYRPREAYFKQLLKSGLQKKWQQSFLLDEPMQEAILQFLQARSPEVLTEFLDDLPQLRAQALANYQSQAARELAAYLASLQQSLRDYPALARATTDTDPVELFPPAGLPQFSPYLLALAPLKASSRLKSAEVLPQLQLQILVTEEDYRGPFPLLRFCRRVLEGGRRPLLVYIKPLKYRPSHVQSSIWRRGWGILRDGQIISLGFNWHYRWPGLIRLDGSKPAARFQAEAAHEFGHSMGLADAYAAWYRSYQAYPASASYLMHSNRELSPEEIRMVFQAQASGHLQHFPYRWSWSHFRQGFLRDIKRQADRLAQESQRRKNSRRASSKLRKAKQRTTLEEKEKF